MPDEKEQQKGFDKSELEKIANQLDSSSNWGEDNEDGFEKGAKSESQSEPEAKEIEERSEDESEKDKSEDENEANKAETGAEPEEVKPVEDEESESGPADAKLEKEQARKDKTWKQIEGEKAAVRKEKEDLKREREEFERKNAFKIPPPREPEPDTAGKLRDEKGFSVDEYAKAARDFENEGDYEHAREARSRAANLNQRINEIQKNKLLETWNKTVEETVDKHPELGDRNSAAAKALEEILRTEQIFTSHPQGFKTAARLALAEHGSASVSALKAKLETKEKEITRLNGLLSVDGDGGAIRHQGERPFKDKPIKEQKSHLRRLAAIADEGFV